jgi:hypothetical protein
LIAISCGIQVGVALQGLQGLQGLLVGILQGAIFISPLNNL